MVSFAFPVGGEGRGGIVWGRHSCLPLFTQRADKNVCPTFHFSPLSGGVAEGRGGLPRAGQRARTHPAADAAPLPRGDFLLPSPGFPVSAKLCLPSSPECGLPARRRPGWPPSQAGGRAAPPFDFAPPGLRSGRTAAFPFTLGVAERSRRAWPGASAVRSSSLVPGARASSPPAAKMAALPGEEQAGPPPGIPPIPNP